MTALLPSLGRGEVTVSKETVSVSGGQLVDRVKELVHEGNVRQTRIIHDGRTLVDVPLSLGVPVAAATVVPVPVMAAFGAIAGLVTDCALEIERVDASDMQDDCADVADSGT